MNKLAVIFAAIVALTVLGLTALHEDGVVEVSPNGRILIQGSR